MNNSMDDVSWQKCVDLLEDKISLNDHRRWVGLLSFCLVNNKSYIVAPSNHFITLLNTKSIWQKIVTVCEQQGYCIPKLISRESQEFSTLDTHLNQAQPPRVVHKKNHPSSSPQTANVQQIAHGITKKLKHKKESVRKKQFDRYTFDNFCEGKSNRIALQIAKSLCSSVEEEQEVLPYNPFFIYGHSGNGKTHLLHAIKNTIHATHTNLSVFYQQADAFVDHLVTAIRNKTMDEFKTFYRQHDLLLIDNVEFFVAKNSSMEEFFQLMNFFIESNRQIILTSDRLPTEIDLPHRIRSRLASGLCASICLPDFELRVNTLLLTANQLQLNISEEIIYFIAIKAKVSIRELCGILKTLKAVVEISFHNREITLSDVDTILAPTLRSMNVMVTPDQVSKMVSDHYGISVNELTSKVRRKPIVFARHLCMYLMRENTSFSLEQIGGYFSRDHSSVIHAVKKIKEQISKDSTASQLVDGMTSRLLNNN